MAHEFFIARRYLRSTQKRGFISLISYMAVGGVVLGVAALVIILSVTNGFSGEVKNRLIGMNAHVTVFRKGGGPIFDYREILEKARDFPGVTGATPVIESKVVIVSKRDLNKMDGIMLWGVEPESFAAVSDLPKHLLYGSNDEILLGELPDEKHPGIILGNELANELKVGPSFEVLAVTMQNMDLEEVMLGGFTPKFWPFLVTDIFESGMYEYDRSFAFVALEDAQKILGLEDAVTQIHLQVEDIYRAAAVRDALQEELGPYPYDVKDWTEIFPAFFEWIELEKWAIFLALSLIILVAAFNIMSILSMSVLIKTPEIGILQAMGCTTRGIRRIFMYQGLVIGVVGTALGCLAGFILCLVQQRFEVISIPGDVYLINSLPVDMEVTDFLLVSAVSLAICLLTSIYPARKASALMPVEAIRYIM